MSEIPNPEIAFDSITLVREFFERKKFVNEDLRVDVKLTPTFIPNGNKSQQNEMSVEISFKSESTGEEQIRIGVTYVGEFSVSDGNDISNLNSFMEQNSFEYILPYIRQRVSDLTLNSGVAPLLMPPITHKDIIRAREKENQEST